MVLYCISGIELDWSTSTRDLGITIDNNLKFDEHISKMVHNVSVRANLLIRSLAPVRILYSSLVTTYCWSN